MMILACSSKPFSHCWLKKKSTRGGESLFLVWSKSTFLWRSLAVLLWKAVPLWFSQGWVDQCEWKLAKHVDLCLWLQWRKKEMPAAWPVGWQQLQLEANCACRGNFPVTCRNASVWNNVTSKPNSQWFVTTGNETKHNTQQWEKSQPFSHLTHLFSSSADPEVYSRPK